MGVVAMKELIAAAGLRHDGIMDKSELRTVAREAAEVLAAAAKADPLAAWEEMSGRQQFIEVHPGFSQGKVQGAWFGTPPGEIPQKPPGVVRFVCISDTHECIEDADFELPAGDVLLHAGDITRKGDATKMARFCDWLKDRSFSHKIVISGNHDACTDAAFTGDTAGSTSQHMAACCTYLHNQSTMAAGICVYGTPFTCWPLRNDGSKPNWAHGVVRGAACEKLCAKIPECDVLLSHQPPLGRRDCVDDIGRGHAGGCRELLTAVQARRPAVHVFGHIHEGYGATSDGVTLFLNVSSLTDGCGSGKLNYPIVFDLACAGE
eukprot:TRINITY_DN6898_c0_g1_i2.p1 TRINITY_DN6898_c0_g1~~TRINITY_DN6898_c0_g1_i2.p1  ORF type:complete len:320 (+),score=52.28 TRINITY_DN6898_c0_g1_i2:104-1063(+)